MRSQDEVKPVTARKTRAAALLRTIREKQRAVAITQGGEPNGAPVDFDPYGDVREATLLLKLIAQGEMDVRVRRTVSQYRVFGTARARLHPLR